MVEKFGGFTGVHPASRSVHLCIADDIYHPYLCNVHSNMSGPNFVPVSASPFMYQPTKNRKKLCSDKIANPDLCTFNNTDTNYPFPWTQHL